METEQKIEHLNELDDGAFQTWLSDNTQELALVFIEDKMDEFEEYAKEVYRDHLK